jgi:hypothetical protein
VPVDVPTPAKEKKKFEEKKDIDVKSGSSGIRCEYQTILEIVSLGTPEVHPFS